MGLEFSVCGLEGFKGYPRDPCLYIVPTPVPEVHQ